MDNNIIGFSSTKKVSAPTISKDLQPWKKHSHEDLIHDLMGCIMGFWNHYRKNTCYSQEEAVSDAFEGILQAIEKDKLPPKFKKGDKITCKNCDHINDAPSESVGDERAAKIFLDCPSGRTPKYRKFNVTCTDCGHDQLEIVHKSRFSTLVFYYIRSSIQRNFGKKYCRGFEVSIDGTQDASLLDTICASGEDRKEELPSAVTDALYKAIDDLVGRQRLVLVLHHGLSDIYAKTTEKDLECENCNDHFTAVVDYNIAKNDIECPNCAHHNMIDMRIQKTIKCHHCVESFNTFIDYSKSKNYADCPCCGTENSVDMCMNQTDIAKVLSVSKQRVCSILKTVTNRLQDALRDDIDKFEVI